MADAILVGEGLRKTCFRTGRGSSCNFDAVAGVSLGLVQGEFVALMGRSGSGKTTLLNMLAGLLAPSEGTVRLGSEDLYALSDDALSRLRNARIGVVPQGQSALHSLTAFENVMLPCVMYGSKPGVGERVDALLDTLGIGELVNMYPSDLSGGELRRVAIARALAPDPDVILADEPTSDLDDENTALVLKVLSAAADEGKAVLMVTHEQAATAYADRVLRMDAGRLVE